MSFERFIIPDTTPTEQVPLQETRVEILQQVRDQKIFDIVVVGGGIIGASVARLAAFNGLRTLLLERDDYGAHTSSRSSKMAHGGLRYLEMGDVRQVFEALQARNELFAAAPHLAHPQQFAALIQRDNPLQRLITSCGVGLYELLAGKLAIPQWRKITDLTGIDPQRYAGGVLFTDGLLDDQRLVIESILGAREEGALCLNYAEVRTIDTKVEGQLLVGWGDRLTDTEHTARTGIVMNCTGAWAPTLARVTPAPHLPPVRYSQGSHILFSTPWSLPALVIDIKKGGRRMFFWPHREGTLVGTTEQSLNAPSPAPMPTSAEIAEIYSLCEEVAPGILTPANATYTFAGIRTLVGESGSESSRLSRRHRWFSSAGIFTMLGGKFTNAAEIAFDGLKFAFKQGAVDRKLIPLGKRPFPGGRDLAPLRIALQAGGVAQRSAERALNRFGSQLDSLRDVSGGFSSADLLDLGGVLSGELSLSLKREQVTSFTDLVLRRLQLQYLPDNGEGALAKVAEFATTIEGGAPKPQNGVAEYRAHLAQVKALLRQ